MDSLSEDRHSPGQGQECSRPRPRTKDTSTSALQKKKKGLHKNFSGDLQKKKVFTKISQAFSTKKRFPKNFSSAPQNFNDSKNSAVLEPRTDQFSRTWGQGQGLDLRGQGLQNVSSRTPPLLNTSDERSIFRLVTNRHNLSRPNNLFYLHELFKGLQFTILFITYSFLKTLLDTDCWGLINRSG